MALSKTLAVFHFFLGLPLTKTALIFFASNVDISFKFHLSVYTFPHALRDSHVLQRYTLFYY